MVRLASRWSIASRVFAVQLAAVIVLSGCLTLVLWLSLRDSANENAGRVTLAVANTLATDPVVVSGVRSPDPSAELQPFALRVMRSTGVDFVTIMDPTGTRFTHPNPAEIGKKFIGTISLAQRGKTLTETYTGTLGPSVRSVVPVVVDGTVIGIVAAGETVTNVAASLAPRIPFVIGAAALLVIVGSIGAFAARRLLSRMTGSMRPSELSRMVDYYESVLHSVREGLILADATGRVVLYNDEAAELLGLPPVTNDLQPRTSTELDLPPTIATLVTSGRRAVEESHVAGHRVLVVNQESATPPGGSTRASVGTLMTLRDRTEVQRLSGELESVRTLSDALRSQTHEYANRLHTVVSLLELGRTRDAIDLIAHQVQLSQSLADDVVGAVNEPALAALLLGKSTQAGERGIELRLEIEQNLAPSAMDPADLVSVVGNLVDNAMDAAAAGSAAPWVRVTLGTNHEHGCVELTVSDSGRGVENALGERIFSPGFSTKPAGATGRGFGLAVVRQVLQIHGGTIELLPGSATEFRARWPIAVAQIPASADDSAGS
ncbi:sensor histidine kinase [Lacisediminihabitans profunda]|nr:ATP-binding protein [Lacisediminihabitans profunda]